MLNLTSKKSLISKYYELIIKTNIKLEDSNFCKCYSNSF